MSGSAAPWMTAHQAPLSMEFSRQESWSGLPFPSPGGLLDLGTEPWSPALQADSLPTEPPGKPPRLSGWALCPMTSVLVRDPQKRDEQRDEGHVKTGAKIGVLQL